MLLIKLLVLEVLRYIVDQQTKRALRVDTDPTYATLKDGFDLVVSDGDTKLTVAVHPSLSSDVLKGAVQPYAVVQLTGYRGWYNDLELLNNQPTQVVLISAWRVLRPGYYPGITGPPLVPEQFVGWAKRPFSPLANALDGQMQRPLFASRSYYVNFFSDATVTFPAQDIRCPFEVTADDVQEMPFLAELAQQFLRPKKNKRANPLPTRVMGRLMKKSAVNHYAKAADEKVRRTVVD